MIVNIIRKLLFLSYLVLTFSILSACSDKVDIQQTYDFTVSHLPVPQKIRLEETVEIRMQINREGYFEDTQYYLRYFQPDGEGSLALEDGTIFLPNDLYKLPGDIFRLYFTSHSEETHKIDIYIQDNFGQMKTLSFNFTHTRD